ncbi:unnamed protein product [Withania somnifera]
MSVLKQCIPSNFPCNAELEVDKWVTLPNLVFDNQSLLISSQDQTFIKNKIVNIVDHALLLHSGPIHKFKLSHRDLQGVCDIDRWILFLSRGHRYKLHSSIHLCQKLIHLELFNCLLKPPLTFPGFKSLKSLDLQHITMEQDAFEHLVSSCHLLERLTLMNFEGFSNLKIHAPNLLFVDVGGVFEDINFMDTFNLAIVSIGLYVNPGLDKNITLGSAGNLVKFFAHLPRLQRLEIQSFFLKYLADGKVPGRLPALVMSLVFFQYALISTIWTSARTEEQRTLRSIANVMEENYQNCMFNQLQHVKIAGISSLKQELNLINFLLANSPILERMTVKPASVDGAWEMLKELLRFRRASVQAEIVYLDP